MRPTLFQVACSFILASISSANDAGWRQYRGPNGDGSTKGSINAWKNLTPAWVADTTNGFSSFAVGEGLACTLVTRDHEGSLTETCIALDAATGKEKWAFPMKLARYDGGGDSGEGNNAGGDGARSTPSISDGKVYVMGSQLDLYCLDAKTGKVAWQVDILADYKGKNIQWQNACSPVIEGSMVLVAGGDKGHAFIALNKEEGKLIWSSGEETITHATPTVATILGVRQVVYFMKSGLVGIDIKDGTELWKQPFEFKISTAASPIVFEDIVYCSAGYGVGGGAYRLKKQGAGFSVEEIWRTPNKNMNHWSTPVCRDGYLYGMFSFKEYGKGPLACVDIRTGEMKWRQPGFGAGNVILAADKLLALSDKGELVLVEAQPGAYKELARTDALEGKCWSTPVLAGGKIFARSTTKGGCFEIK